MKTSMKLALVGIVTLGLATSASAQDWPATGAVSVGMDFMSESMAHVQSMAAHAQARSSQTQSMADAAPRAVSFQADTAEVVYRDARRALNNSDFRQAARLFSQLRRDYPESVYVGDAYYFEAFALYRAGGTSGMERALDLLDTQQDGHSDASTREDAPSLRVQIEGALARTGDRERGRRIQERASDPCGEDDELRSAALNALLNMNADKALPILVEVLESRDECSVELRRQAVFLVSQHMTSETVDILLDLAHRNPDPDQEVREQAVFWLSQVNSPEAISALESILRTSDDREIQEKAVFALSQHSGSRSTEILKEYAERNDVPAELREKAIFWLGQSDGGGEYLRELYGSVDSDELREKIIFGVSQSGEREDGDWLLERALDKSESIDVRKNALFWAGQMGMDVGRLADLYQSVSDPEMKEQIIFVLSQASDEPAAVDELMEIARGEDDGDLQKNAIFWLGQMDDDRVAEFLLSLIRGVGGPR
jgi:HEAT repeat protein